MQKDVSWRKHREHWWTVLALVWPVFPWQQDICVFHSNRGVYFHYSNNSAPVTIRLVCTHGNSNQCVSYGNRAVHFHGNRVNCGSVHFFSCDTDLYYFFHMIFCTLMLWFFLKTVLSFTTCVSNLLQRAFWGDMDWCLGHVTLADEGHVLTRQCTWNCWYLC